MQWFYVVSAIIATGFVVNILLAFTVVFFEHRKPASTWAWLLVLFYIPVFGFIIYLIFGRDGKKERVFTSKGIEDYKTYLDFLEQKEKYEAIQREQDEIFRFSKIQDHYSYLKGMILMLIKCGSWITEGNQFQVFKRGENKFNALIDDIRKAKSSIHLEYYIIRGDDLGRRLVHELALKAKEGLEVRLLYDGMGCTGLPKAFFNELKQSGGQTAAFLPPFFVRLNYRNHRKIAIIDGKIGYVGGFNVGNEYLGIVKRYGPWRDTHLRLEGDCVDGLQLRFLMDWKFTSGENISFDQKYFPKREKQKEGALVQIVSSGPDTKMENIRNGYMRLISSAQKNIYIETPYFVPDDALLESLKVAALSGVDVRIIYPAHPDHLFVYWASTSYLGELLRAGVRCFQYERGFIHAKSMVIYGTAASVGSANMDVRSFALNFEINGFIYDHKLAMELEDVFCEDMKYCEELTLEWYQKRPLGFRFREAVSRLISPIL